MDSVEDEQQRNQAASRRSMIVPEHSVRRYVRRFEREDIPTRLELFIVSRKIKRAELAREANVSRQHLLRVRLAHMDLRRGVMARIVSAARRLSLEAVRPEELFELFAEDSGRWTIAEDRDRVIRAAAVYAAELAAAEQRVEALEKRPVADWLDYLETRGDAITIPLLRLLLRNAHRQLDLDARRASAMYALAAELTDRLPEPVLPDLTITIRGLTFLYRAYAARHLGLYADALAFLDAAEREMEGSPACATELAQVWYERAALFFKRGDIGPAEREAKRSVMLFHVLGDLRRVARAQILHGSLAFERGDVARARDLWLRAIDPLRAAEDHDAVASVTMNIGAAETLLGNVDAAKSWLTSAQRLFVKLNVRTEIIRVRWTLARLHLLHINRWEGLRMLRAVRADYLGANLPTEAGFVGLDLVETLFEDEAASEELVGLARSVVEAFEKAGATPKMLQALHYVREAVRRRDPELVSEVRADLREAERGTTASFVPRARSVTASESTGCLPG